MPFHSSHHPPPPLSSPNSSSAASLHSSSTWPMHSLSMSTFAISALFALLALLMVLPEARAESSNEEKALLVADEVPEVPEKRFGAQRFAFAKRRAFAFAKRGLGDDFGGRAFAFAKRASDEPIDFDQLAAEKRFAFADSGARRFAFAKRAAGEWPSAWTGRQFAFAR